MEAVGVNPGPWDTRRGDIPAKSWVESMVFAILLQATEQCVAVEDINPIEAKI